MVAIFNLRNLTFMRMLRRHGQHVVLNLLLLMKDVSLPALSLCILLLTPSLPPNQSVFIHKYFFYHLAKGEGDNLVMRPLFRTLLTKLAKVNQGVHSMLLGTLLSPLFKMGAFLWNNPDQDQWSEITRIMVDQKNQWIHSGQGFIGSSDLTWSEWSRITDPYPDRPKRTHP